MRLVDLLDMLAVVDNYATVAKVVTDSPAQPLSHRVD
jgi:hypothetical protein